MGNFFDGLKREYLQNAAFRLILLVGLVFLTMKYAVPVVAPFLLGIILVTGLRPHLYRLAGNRKWIRSLLMGAVLLLVAAIPCLLAVVLYRAGMNCISACMEHMEELKTQCTRILHTGCCYLQKWSGMDSSMLEERIMRTAEGMGAQMSDEAIPAALNVSGGLIVKATGIGVLWAVFFIFSILLARDYEEIEVRLGQYGWYRHARHIYGRTVGMLVSYVRAQLIIMSVIGGICSVTFWILRYPVPFFWGYLVGFLDMLPFIGTGITLIPLALFEFILGNTKRAVAVILLYIVCYFVRQFMEPRLIGKKVGIHPLIILISVFVGVKLYGIAGILTGPLSYLLIRELYHVPEAGAAREKTLDK